MSGPRLEFFQAASRQSPRRQILDGFRAERRQMSEQLRRQRVDVVHAHWTYEWALVAASAKVGPVIVTVHDAPLTVLIQNRGVYWLGRLVLGIRARIAFRHANLTAVSSVIAQKYGRQMMWRDRIEVIPNCLDIEASPRNAIHASADRMTVTEIADGSRRKNVRGLLQAFELVLQKFPGVTLNLIGPGLSSEDKTAEWARQRGLASSVNFSGQLDRADAMRVLESSTIHAHASHEESFGLSVLESMALGIPVVAAKGSGGPEWLLSNDAGLIVDAGDPHEFADGIVSLLLDRVRRDSIREAASLRFAEEFQPAAVASRYEAFYKSVIAAKTVRDRRDA